MFSRAIFRDKILAIIKTAHASICLNNFWLDIVRGGPFDNGDLVSNCIVKPANIDHTHSKPAVAQENYNIPVTKICICCYKTNLGASVADIPQG